MEKAAAALGRDYLRSFARWSGRKKSVVWIHLIVKRKSASIQSFSAISDTHCEIESTSLVCSSSSSSFTAGSIGLLSPILASGCGTTAAIISSALR